MRKKYCERDILKFGVIMAMMDWEILHVHNVVDHYAYYDNPVIFSLGKTGTQGRSAIFM